MHSCNKRTHKYAVVISPTAKLLDQQQQLTLQANKQILLLTSQEHFS
ncbi:MAG: DUF536 domain-containing protein [Enterococcus faecium]